MGRTSLKFFPSSVFGISGFKAMSAVLPANVKTYAVGGAGPENFGDWLSAGITDSGLAPLYIGRVSVPQMLRAVRMISLRPTISPFLNK